jgi:phosphate transport system protein
MVSIQSLSFFPQMSLAKLHYKALRPRHVISLRAALRGSIKMAAELERSADYAAHLAKATKFFAGEPQWRQTEMIEQMVQIGATMITGTVQAFISRSALQARQVALMDDQIDHIHKSLIKEMVMLLGTRPEDAEKVAKFIQVSGYLERLGDHMTNACESIIYMVEGIHMELNL